MRKIKKRDIKTVSFVIFIFAILILTCILYPAFKNLDSVDNLAKALEGYGFKGVLLLFFVQILQVVVALIPGEVIEFAAGMIFGTFGGFFICMAGLMCGQFIVFKTVSVLGENLLELILNKKFINKFSFLKSEKKVKRLTFLLFFIPGTPKDALTYFVPITGIRLKDFMVISTLARIPSVLSSTYAGGQLAKWNIRGLVMIYLIMAIFGIIGLVVYDKLFKKDKKSGTDKNNS